MNNSIRFVILYLISGVISLAGHGQITVQITGPTCVVLGTVYNYSLDIISGPSGPSYSGGFSYCVDGGTVSVDPACGSVGLTHKVLHISWTSNGGEITLTSPVGNAFLVTNTAPPLTTGAITPGGSQAINYNDIPGPISCGAATYGACSPAYSYQWLQSSDNINFSNAASTSLTLSFTSGLTQTTYYKLRTKETTSGSTVYSATDTVKVYPLLVIGSLSPSSQSINYNTAPSPLSISGVTGGSGSYNYQWQRSPTSSFSSITSVGTNSANYAPPPLTATFYYRVGISSNGGTVLYSNAVLVTVTPQVFGGTITPGALTVSSGTSPGSLTANAASGGGCSGHYTYQWQQSTDGNTFSVAPGVDTTQSYTPGNLSVTTYYRRRVVCGTDSAYTNVTIVTIGMISSSVDMNYIRTRDITKPGVTDTVTANHLTDPNDVKQTTVYFDGLGRSVQTVGRQASPRGKDIVSIQVYDPFGRETTQYLPYVSPSNDGNYKINVLQEQNIFNSSQFSNDQFYYKQTDYEASPLNRPLTLYPPGSSWVGSRRGMSSQRLFNTTSDSVQIWNIADAVGSPPANAGTYPAGQLYKNVTIDEQNHQAIEYKDKVGHVVLKKVLLASAPMVGHVGWLCTYYVYDNQDNLRFVLPPRAVELINTATNHWSISQPIADELCFRYEYDGRNRMIIKKVPGAGEVWMVYDARDRLVMSQDSVQRTGTRRWLVTKYDNLNRPDSTVLWTDPNTRVYHQNLAGGSTNYPVVAGTFTLLTRDFYDDYSWMPGFTALSPTLVTKYATNSHYFITNYNTSPTYAVPIVQSLMTRGLPTGHLSAIVTSVGVLTSVNFYDDHGRIIQKIAGNWANTADTTTTQYDFSGKPLRTLFNHGNTHNSGHYYKILTKMNYDAGARLTSVWKNIDSAATDQRIDSMQYNELGQLKSKYLGNNLDSLAYEYNIRGWLATINKNYLKQNASSPPLNYFGMELGYDKTVATVTTTSYKGLQYNGNIAGTLWKSAGDEVNRQYDFSYDNTNRLTKADFKQQFPGGWGKIDSLNSKSVPMDFSTDNLTYDANGNIGSTRQKGFKLGGSVTIDSLSYGYLSNSNKLNQVMDGANDTASVLGDFHYKGTKGSLDYRYDGNGNLTQDNNKGITSISYTYQNLPSLVNFGHKGFITYDYDAEGNRLRKRIFDSLSRHVTVHLYINGLDYRYTDTITGSGHVIDTLDYVPTEEGRIRWAFHKYLNDTTKSGWEYDFFEKDHLGNTRVVLSQEKDTAHYMATIETVNRATEDALFANIDSTAFATGSVPGYPGDTTTNKLLSKVNGTVHKMGPALLLKVMSGDSVVFVVQSYYRSGVTAGSPNSSIQDVLNSLAGGLMSVTGGGHGAISAVNTTTNPVAVAVTSFLPAKDSPTTTTKPKAYLNWMLLDNQFSYVSGQSGAQQVGAADAIIPLANTFKLKQSGYLYIWVSNETPNWDAFFDNLSVCTYNGPMLEENHYYPFGLAMAGISDKALKPSYVENKFRYNKGSELENKEFSDGSGLEMYETSLRELDPQLGRWWQMDSKPDYAQSLYAAMGNNPILHNDVLGDSAGGPQQTNHWYNNIHLTPAQPGQYETEPVKAVLADVSYQLGNIVGQFFGIEQTRDAINTVRDGKTATGDDASTVDKMLAVATSALSTTRGEGGHAEKAPVQPYEVGMTKDLWARSVTGDNLSVHHAPQGKPAGQLIDGYDYSNAPGIVLPKGEHADIPNLKGENTAGTPRQQLAQDIRNLRNYTNAPNSSLQQLIDLNKFIWPEQFKK